MTTIWGGTLISITVYNAEQTLPHDLFVQVYDLNLQGGPQALNARVNVGMSSAPFQIQEDGNGAGQITWTVTAADDPNRTGSSSSPITPSDGGQVPVSSSP